MAETEVITGFGAILSETYKSLISTLPTYGQNFVNLFLIVLLVVIYSIAIWKFYRFIATKDFLGLNLSKYNKSQHPFLTKLFAGILYFIEYIIVLPFLIFFWYAIFTIFLIILTEGIEVSTILIVSATIIATIRITSYYKEELAKELAKLLPFTLLAISIIRPNFFSIERIFSHINQIPGSITQIVTYLAFIIILEIILRFFDFLVSLFGLEES